MKPRRLYSAARLYFPLASAFAALLTATSVHAQSGTWTQTGAGPFDWGTSGNWSGGTVASGVEFTASFTSNITADQTVNLAAAQTIGNITFTDSTNSSHNLTISGANILTLDRTAGVPVINVTQSGRTLTISSQISGSDGLQKDGAGTLVLSNGSNNYTNGTTVTAGTLGFASGALGTTGTINASGATLQWLAGNTQDISSRLSTPGGVITTLDTNGNDVTFASPLGLGATNAQIVKTGLGTLTLQATSNYTGTTTVNVGTLALDYTTVASKLTDTVALILGGGTLELRNGASSHTEVVLSTTLTAGTSSFVTRTSGTSVLQMNDITNSTGTVNFGAENIATTDDTNTNGILGAWATVGGDWAINSGSATSGGVTVPGAGIGDGFIRAYTAYTDVTRLSSGTKVISNGATTNVRIIDGTGSTGDNTVTGTIAINTLNQSATGGASSISMAGQTLRTDGILMGATAGTLTIGAAGGSALLSGTLTNQSGLNGSLVFTNQSTNEMVINSVLADNSTGNTYAKAGTGTLVLAGDNTFNGAFSILEGLVKAGKNSTSNSIGPFGGANSSASIILANKSGAGLDLNNFNVFVKDLQGGGALGGNVTLTSTKTLTINNPDSGSAIYAGTIGGLGNLTVNGSSQQTFNSAHTYTGITSLQGATLSVNTLADGGIASGIGQSAAAAGNLVFTGGALAYNSGLDATTNRAFTLGGNGTLLVTGAGAANWTSAAAISHSVATAKTLTVGGNGTGLGTLAAAIGDNTGATAITKTGTGTWALTNTGSNFTGAITLNTTATSAGTLSYASAGGANAITFNQTTLTATLSYLGATDKTMSGPITANALTTGTITFDSSGAGAVNYSNTASLGFAASGNKRLTLSGTNTGINTFAGGWTENTGGTSTLTKSGAGTWVLSGNNNYSGATTISAGVLRITSSTALGTAAGGVTVASGSGLEIDGTGGTVTVGAEAISIAGGGVTLPTPNLGAIRNIAGNNTYGGTVTLTAQSRINSDSGTLLFNNATAVNGAGQNLIVGGAGNITISGLIATVSGTVTKDGLGTVTLSGLSATAASNYTGTTFISRGTLAITHASTAALTGGLTFGSVVSSANAGTLDLTNANATFSGAFLAQTNTSTANTVTIGSGKTLATNGNVTIGANAIGQTTNLTVSGATAGVGSWTITNAAASGSFQVGGATGTSNSSAVIADLSGLGTFNANLSAASSVFRIGDASTFSTATVTQTLKLAATSTITAATVGIGDSSGGGGGAVNAKVLSLGTGVNTINANTINIGETAPGGSRGSGLVNFQHASNGSLIIRSQSGSTGTANLTMVNNGNNGTTQHDAKLLLAGHTVDVSLNSLVMAARSNSGPTGGADALITFDTGSFTALTTAMAARTGSIPSTTNTTGTITIGGGTASLGAVTMAVNTSSSATASPGATIANLNISNGAVTASSINMANAGNTGGSKTATANINLTGGSLTLAGNISRTGGAGTENATITLNGGTLNMAGFNMGVGAAAISLVAQQGTLQSAGTINGSGGLTKTTAGTLKMEGTNAYTGATTISGGVLQIGDGSTTGRLSATTSIVNNANLTINRSDAFSQATDLGAGVAITGTGSFTQAGGGTTTLTATNTYSGTTTISGGVLQIGSGGTTGRLSATTGIVNNANLTVNRSDAFSQATDFGADVAITGSGSFTQAGAGTTTLTAVNTYTGATNVNAGALIINGIISPSSATTVAPGATLGGSGTIGPATISGILAPGNSIGTLSAAGDVTWNANNAWKFELGSAAMTQALANTTPGLSDLLNITGAGNDFLKGTGTSFTFDFAGTGENGFYKLVDWNSAATTNFLVSNFVATNLPPTRTATFLLDSGTSALYLEVVPEPSTALLSALGVLALLRRRR